LSGGDVILDVTVYDWGALENPDGIDAEIRAIIIDPTEDGILFDDYFQIDDPVSISQGSDGISGVYRITVPNAHPASNEDHRILVRVVSAFGSYKPPLDGWPYPAAALSSYVFADVPINETGPFVVTQIAGLSRASNTEPSGMADINYFIDENGFQMVNVHESRYSAPFKTIPLSGEPVDHRHGPPDALRPDRAPGGHGPDRGHATPG